MFLTYPQFASAEEVLDLNEIKSRIIDQLSHYVRDGRIVCFDRGVVAREKHVDGAQHLHIYLHAVLRDGCSKVLIKHCDLDLGKHGNYQAARSDDAVIKYCAKEEDYIWWGRNPKDVRDIRNAKRSLVLADVLSGAKSVETIVDEHPEYLLLYDRIVKNLSQFRAAKRQRSASVVPEFLFLTGPSGVGKTTLALSLAPAEETFPVPLPQKGTAQWWFDGYQGQRVLVFDNVSPATAPPYDLLCQMVDKYTVQVPIKGGFVACAPSVIVITSVQTPQQLWGDLWDAQMKRRLTQLWTATVGPATTQALADLVSRGETHVGFSERARTTITWNQENLEAWKILSLPPKTLELRSTLCGIVQRVLEGSSVAVPVSVPANPSTSTNTLVGSSAMCEDSARTDTARILGEDVVTLEDALPSEPVDLFHSPISQSSLTTSQSSLTSLDRMMSEVQDWYSAMPGRYHSESE